MSWLNPSTFIGALLVTVIGGLIVGFFAGKTYEQRAKVKNKGNHNSIIVNSIMGDSDRDRK